MGYISHDDFVETFRCTQCGVEPLLRPVSIENDDGRENTFAVACECAAIPVSYGLHGEAILERWEVADD